MKIKTLIIAALITVTASSAFAETPARQMSNKEIEHAVLTFLEPAVALSGRCESEIKARQSYDSCAKLIKYYDEKRAYITPIMQEFSSRDPNKYDYANLLKISSQMKRVENTMLRIHASVNDY